jgi:hypothetical protein
MDALTLCHPLYKSMSTRMNVLQRLNGPLLVHLRESELHNPRGHATDLVSHQDRRFAYLIPQKFASKQGNLSQFGLPNVVKSLVINEEVSD